MPQRTHPGLGDRRMCRLGRPDLGGTRRRTTLQRAGGVEARGTCRSVGSVQGMCTEVPPTLPHQHEFVQRPDPTHPRCHAPQLAVSVALRAQPPTPQQISCAPHRVPQAPAWRAGRRMKIAVLRQLHLSMQQPMRPSRPTLTAVSGIARQAHAHARALLLAHAGVARSSSGTEPQYAVTGRVAHCAGRERGQVGVGLPGAHPKHGRTGKQAHSRPAALGGSARLRWCRAPGRTAIVSS